MGLSREHYYAEATSRAATWWGRGAERLGLGGPVLPEQVRSLFAGLSPDGSTELRQVQHRPGSQQVAAFDVTFSAPKSVSILWALGDEETRNRILAAHDKAVTAALCYLQDEAAYTRHGHGGSRRDPTGLAVLLSPHDTSRATDPQLHTHAVAMNVGFRLDGSTGALDGREFYAHAKAAGAIYRAELAHELTSLGYELDVRHEPRWTGFEVRGVPDSLIAAFSRRRVDIEQTLAARGEAGPKAAEVAALDTRERKHSTPPSDELARRWHKTAREHGLEPDMLPRPNPHGISPQAAERDIVQVAFDHASTQHLTTKRELVLRMAREALAAPAPTRELRHLLDEALASTPQLIRVRSLQRDTYRCRRNSRARSLLTQERTTLHERDRDQNNSPDQGRNAR